MFSNELICNILIYLNDNIHRNITIDELSRRFFFNRTYIMKKFKKELSISIINYINNIRIYNSLNDYKFDDFILKIAIKNGFSSLEYYSEIFKRIMGVNPQTYKRFINHYRDINEKELNTIRRSIIKLQQLREKEKTYRATRKPVVLPVKNLSMFK